MTMSKISNLEFTPLETKNLYLKLLTLDDAAEVYKHFRDENITRYMDIEPCKDLKEAKEIIQFHIDDSGCRWGIYTKSNNEFVGTCGFHYLRQSHNILIAEIGFDLSSDYWGKGIMFEVLQEIIKYGFEYMKLDVIDATVEQQNERSQRLMNKLGFIKVPKLQDNLIYFYLNKEDIFITK
ncbi:GNAT family N-acetyltransferase [Cytobacillus sp. IB215316]|uniref:GNAT family N-acetyltransferase n=1 Tax=Cytobacillus sp. IB215316 TaxID=3097354 RepID=UPI002A0E66A9|nr:GNAT family N-acetyltransferase [Cytobacillus sp. IB215316]MDX8362733.1 GNAT family N-acetyltransferase [Cytobacillus sp. IB215316]